MNREWFKIVPNSINNPQDLSTLKITVGKLIWGCLRVSIRVVLFINKSVCHLSTNWTSIFFFVCWYPSRARAIRILMKEFNADFMQEKKVCFCLLKFQVQILIFSWCNILYHTLHNKTDALLFFLREIRLDFFKKITFCSMKNERKFFIFFYFCDLTKDKICNPQK